MTRKVATPHLGAIFGIGVDIVQIARMQRLLDRHGTRVIDKLLTTGEKKELRARANPARSLAMSWAAKEACVKAMGTGFSAIGFKDIGVLRADNGRPYLIFNAAQKKRMREMHIGTAHLSLSDDGGMACAYVVLEHARQAQESRKGAKARRPEASTAASRKERKGRKERQD